ncbi:MAG TPA: tRNA epoxyqueuosine(34) reductase QueG [Gemmatimonadaceae bacterium]|nr:tRNA epoxyqueuosine(34) reductase QueG [Gemmatimonadaceae bacterium]
MTVIATEVVATEQLIKAQAFGLGFDLVGIAPLGPVETAGAFRDWLDRGFAGEMGYLARGAEKRGDSRLPFPGTVSAIVVGLNYGGRAPDGPVARYARGQDYHDVMLAKLESLHAWLNAELGRPVAGKAYVDTGPLLERDLARRAGLGWQGKNTNLVNPRVGSFFFIGALLVDLELEPDTPFAADRCGSCRRCLDACPTDAFVGDRVLDATRCISYLTIEQKGPIPVDLREKLGSRLYGCDICQDVCPWNIRFATEHSEPTFDARELIAGSGPADLARAILSMNTEAFQETFKGSPMKRAKQRGLTRNAAVVLGNVGDESDIALLDRTADNDDPLVREHAEWARERLVRNAPR